MDKVWVERFFADQTLHADDDCDNACKARKVPENSLDELAVGAGLAYGLEGDTVGKSGNLGTWFPPFSQPKLGNIQKIGKIQKCLKFVEKDGLATEKRPKVELYKIWKFGEKTLKFWFPEEK